MQVAWRGTNDKCGNVGIYVVRFTQPYPDRAIRSFEFKALDTDTKWMILGITLSDGPEFLPPWSEISYGMPDKWGAASLVFALLEGLGGVKDLGIAFDKSRIAPRWSAAGVNRARVAVRYPASRGSVRYDYQYDSGNRRIKVVFTGNADLFRLQILLPQGTKVDEAMLDDEEVKLAFMTIEGSQYFSVEAKWGVQFLELQLS